jgi:dCMP deaminase
MPNRHHANMAVASLYAQRSKANRLKVGAVIVRDDRIISTGYNGLPSGMDNVCEEDNVTKPEVVHGEINAILFAAKYGVATNDCDLYVTHAPCVECAKAIVQSGIKRVYFGQAYRSDLGLKLLEKANIPTINLGEDE